MKEMYGLFYNTYDYYEWHDLVAVSEDKESLKDLIDNEKPLLEGVAQEQAAKYEVFHWVIEPIKVV